MSRNTHSPPGQLIVKFFRTISDEELLLFDMKYELDTTSRRLPRWKPGSPYFHAPYYTGVLEVPAHLTGHYFERLRKDWLVDYVARVAR